LPNKTWGSGPFQENIMRISTSVHKAASIKLNRFTKQSLDSGGNFYTVDIVITDEYGAEYVVTVFSNKGVPNIEVDKHEVV
jgi:hypothetical protein